MKITKLEHACLDITDGGGRLIIDPGGWTSPLNDYAGITAVVVTHVHGDHLDESKILKITEQNPNVPIFCTEQVAAKLSENFNTKVPALGSEYSAGPFKLEFFGGMREREYYLPSQLSGGQIQCVAIARALVNNPKLIIADEPTGNLDSAGSRLVMELLSEVHRMGNTIIFVTHNPELTRYANRVVYMHDGSIVQDEDTAIGQIAPRAIRAQFKSKKTIDDDLAGISALMKQVPTKERAVVRKKPQKPSRTRIKKKAARR